MVNGVGELEANFKFNNIKTNEDNLRHRIRYKFRKQETIGQLENVFVFDLETSNVEKFNEAYAAGLYNVNRLHDRWDRDLPFNEILTEKASVIVFDIMETLL